MWIWYALMLPLVNLPKTKNTQLNYLRTKYIYIGRCIQCQLLANKTPNHHLVVDMDI